MAGAAELLRADSTRFEGDYSRDAVRRMLAAYTKPDTLIGITRCLVEFAIYAALIAGVLFIESLWLKIVCSVLAGMKLANFATLGHDGVHGNLTSSRRLNKLVAVICFLPCTNNYRLWAYDHLYIHHPFTNGDHEDAWVPFSKEEFDRLPRWRQMLERFYRSSWGLGIGPYYIIERWIRVKVFPRAFLPARFHASAWRYFALLAAYTAAFIGFLAAAPHYSPTSSLTAVLLGFVVPFYVWQTIFSFTAFVTHTHARIPFVEGPVDRKDALPQEQLSLHLKFPPVLDYLMHNVYNHSAHHGNVRIPFYRLPEAQRRLNEMMGSAAVIQPFSFRWLGETLRNCRLYDYQAHRWLNFDGCPTSETAISPEQRAVIAATPGTMFVRRA